MYMMRFMFAVWHIRIILLVVCTFDEWYEFWAVCLPLPTRCRTASKFCTRSGNDSSSYRMVRIVASFLKGGMGRLDAATKLKPRSVRCRRTCLATKPPAPVTSTLVMVSVSRWKD